MTNTPHDESGNPREELEPARRATPSVPDVTDVQSAVRTTELQSAARGSWSYAEMQPDSGDRPVRRERVFPRKVLVGWALLALVVYFGVRLVTTVAKESVREAIKSRTEPASSNTAGKIVIVLPNGERITINRDRSARTGPPVSGAPRATPAANAPAAPQLPPPRPPLSSKR
jgi:hypothetical protein